MLNEGDEWFEVPASNHTARLDFFDFDFDFLIWGVEPSHGID
jgi:hypothetical protein